MIYLQNTTESQVLFIPRAITPGNNPPLVFKAVNTIDLSLEINQEVIDLQTSGQYYNIAVTLPSGVQSGEYEYNLIGDGLILASGLLVIGENFSPSEYNKDITYEQYETE